LPQFFFFNQDIFGGKPGMKFYFVQRLKIGRVGSGDKQPVAAFI